MHPSVNAVLNQIVAIVDAAIKTAGVEGFVSFVDEGHRVFLQTSRLTDFEASLNAETMTIAVVDVFVSRVATLDDSPTSMHILFRDVNAYEDERLTVCDDDVESKLYDLCVEVIFARVRFITIHDNPLPKDLRIAWNKNQKLVLQ